MGLEWGVDIVGVEVVKGGEIQLAYLLYNLLACLFVTVAARLNGPGQMDFQTLFIAETIQDHL